MGDQIDTPPTPPPRIDSSPPNLPPKRVTLVIPDEIHEEPDPPKPNEAINIPKKTAPLCGLLEFVTLKILFVDLLVSVGDVGSDFGFSWQLYEKSIEEKDDLLFKYAAIVFSINWFPGIVAAIHVLSMYRKKEGQSPQAILVYALLMLVFYPVVPVLGYLVLLYCRPKVRMCHS